MQIEVKFELDTHEKKQLAATIGCKEEELEDKLQPYAVAALREYIQMFLGQRLPQSGVETRQNRLSLLIQEVFDVEIPNEYTVSRLFQITPSQGKTLLRSVTSKYHYELQDILDKSYIVVLQSCLYNANEEIYECSIKNTHIIDGMNIILSSKDGYLPKITRSYGMVSAYTISISSYKALCNHFNVSLSNSDG